MEADFFTQVAPATANKSKKAIVIENMADGKVVPIIGNMFMNDLAFSNHDALTKGWASFTRYPFADQLHDCARIAQFASVSQAGDGLFDETRIKKQYLEFLKAALQLLASRDAKVSASRRAEVAEQARNLTVSEMARRFDYPALEDPTQNPLLLLAQLPLPVYITTGYHDFLEVALREKAGKEPQTEVCIWHEGLRSIPSIYNSNQGYEPSVQKPLVYHLHGLDLYPESLILTEDDYLDFLNNLAKNSYVNHARIKQALTESSLVMIGYRPRDWDFRAVFRGVIKPRPPGMWKDSVAIQLEKEATGQEYLQKYMRQAMFEVEWMEPGQFIRELYEGWEQR